MKMERMPRKDLTIVYLIWRKNSKKYSSPSPSPTKCTCNAISSSRPGKREKRWLRKEIPLKPEWISTRRSRSSG